MAEAKVQTYANHARLDPSFHYVLTLLVVVSLVLGVIAVVHHPGAGTAALVVLAAALFLNSWITRTYSLKVQSRVIRLEEKLRLSTLAPESLKPRLAELTVPQWVALRFASDAEVSALAARALDEGLTNKQIKQAIQTWRPDVFRV